jgi:acyl-CoA hydrolase
MMYVVTEFGKVNLKGKCVPERAKAMISIAHPDFRDDLERQARENGLIPKAFA